MKIHLTQKAKSDLKAIYKYSVQQWGVAQADNYHKIISQKLHKLTTNPKMGKNFDETLPKQRRYILKHHIAIYKIDNDRIKIVRILHKNMNIDAQS